MVNHESTKYLFQRGYRGQADSTRQTISSVSSHLTLHLSAFGVVSPAVLRVPIVGVEKGRGSEGGGLDAERRADFIAEPPFQASRG